MTRKRNTAPRSTDAVQVFRQFAWHLAGTLSGVKAVGRPPARKPRPAKGAMGSR